MSQQIVPCTNPRCPTRSTSHVVGSKAHQDCLKDMQKKASSDKPSSAPTTPPSSSSIANASTDGLDSSVLWTADNYDWSTFSATDEAEWDIGQVLKDLRNYDPNHEGYLMVATPSSHYGSIGLPGAGNGYKIARRLDDAIINTSDLERVTKGDDGELVLETANHDFAQRIVVYRLNSREYNSLYDAPWQNTDDFAKNLTKKPLTFKKGS